jgi:hypothetical protein
MTDKTSLESSFEHAQDRSTNPANVYSIVGKITIETKATNALRTNALVHTFRLTQRFRHVEQNVVITLRSSRHDRQNIL